MINSRVLRDEEINLLLENGDEKVVRLALKLVLYCGASVWDVYNLKVGDVDFGKESISFSNRVLPMHPELEGELGVCQGADIGLRVISILDKSIEINSSGKLREMVERYVNAILGREDFKFEDLRVTFIEKFNQRSDEVSVKKEGGDEEVKIRL
ncbi:MAG: hypothetical protein LBF97_04930 [Elusimicrobiota bacterium]|jgi:integrase|nr:hypothetical protein [Elusimicrobiota bacterium]